MTQAILNQRLMVVLGTTSSSPAAQIEQPTDALQGALIYSRQGPKGHVVLRGSCGSSPGSYQATIGGDGEAPSPALTREGP